MPNYKKPLVNTGGFFSEAEIEAMAEAVKDHRTSLKGDPRSIYGKINGESV